MISFNVPRTWVQDKRVWAASSVHSGPVSRNWTYLACGYMQMVMHVVEKMRVDVGILGGNRDNGGYLYRDCNTATVLVNDDLVDFKDLSRRRGSHTWDG